MFFALNCVHTLSSHNTLAGNMLIIQPTSSGKSACISLTSRVESMVTWLESNVSGPETTWTHQMLLDNFARLQRRAWTEFSTLQSEVHRDLLQNMRRIQADDADVAASCADAGVSEDAADAAFNDLADCTDFEAILSILAHRHSPHRYHGFQH